jgi:hypothetical protein
MRRSFLIHTPATVALLAAALVSTQYATAEQRGTRGGGAGATRASQGAASVSRGAYGGSANVQRSGTANVQRGGSYGGTANVQRSGSYSGTASASRTSVNRSAEVNRNVNVSRDVNVDVDNHYDYRPGTGLAVAATAAAVSAVAVGTVAYSIPPSCVPVVAGGVTYQQCGSTWYQPQYAGTSVTYVVTNPPG